MYKFIQTYIHMYVYMCILYNQRGPYSYSRLLSNNFIPKLFNNKATAISNEYTALWRALCNIVCPENSHTIYLFDNTNKFLFAYECSMGHSNCL